MKYARRGRKIVIAMVGLPARGKTFTARKLVGYLSWLGYPTRSFNVGEARRTKLGPGQSSDFFDPQNVAGEVQRRALAESVLADAFDWLRSEGRIAIYDATNSTRERRDWIAGRCREEDRDLLFVEISTKEELVEDTIRETKITSPDYEGRTEEEALADFRERIAHYEGAYEPLEPDEGAWVRLVDRGRQIVINRVHGWIFGRILSFLGNFQVAARPVWLTRHGESQFNREDRVGGDSELSPRGQAYATELARHVRRAFRPDDDLDVWTSTLARTVQTAEPLEADIGRWRALDEINAGVCDGLTYAEIDERYPDVASGRSRDKFEFRYPGGESYADVVSRVDRVIIELERYQTPVLVIAHRAVLRALYAYFMQLSPREAPHIDMPLHTVIKLTPTAYGCLEERVELPPKIER